MLTLPCLLGVLMLPYIAAYLGLASWQAGHMLLTLGIMGWTSFAALIFSGWSRRVDDPMLVFPQTVFAVLMMALSYHLVEVGRGVAMLWLALIFTFDMRRLSMKQIVTLALLAVSLQILQLGWALRTQDRVDALTEEWINLGCVALLLAELTMIARHAGALLKLREDQRARLRATFDQLSYLSTRDTLTGAYNRRHIMQCLETEAMKTRRSGRPFSLALIDLDHFKQINDQFGHATGDAVLKAFVELAQKEFGGPMDAVARWGGEEFVILMPESTADKARARLTRLQERVRAHDWSDLHTTLSVSFSAGLTEHHDHGEIEHSLDRADRALYCAKAEGRDRIRTHQVAPSSRAMATAHLPPDHDDRASPRRDTDGKHPPDAMRRPSAMPPAAEPAEPPAYSPLSRLILSDDPITRLRCSMVLVGASGYIVGLLVLCLYAMPLKLMPRTIELILLAYLVLIILLPYPLIRSGWTRRLQDPGMLLQQNLFGFVGVVVAYAYAPVGKSGLLVLLCLIHVYGFLSLTPSKAKLAGACLIGMLTLAWVLRTLSGDPSWAATTEGVRLLASLPVFALLTSQAQRYALIHQRVREDHEQLDQAVAEVKRMSTRDALTGLCNRQHLQDVLQAEAGRSRRTGGRLSIAMVDLDHFKRINDSEGHGVGDEVLVGFGRLAQEVLRQTDVVGRWGGEEFVVVMPEAQPERGSVAALERLRERVSSTRLSSSAPHLEVSFSAGIAVHEDGETWQQTLARADRLLYEAKSTGRNQCRFIEEPAEVAL